MFGYSAEEFLNADTSLLAFEEDQTKARVELRDEINTLGSDLIELRLRRKDGSEIWVEMTTEPFSADGESRVLGIKRDITERKQAEDDLEKSKTQFQDIVEYSQSNITVKDLEGRYILVNPAFEKDNDISSQELMGKTVYDFFPKEKADEFWQQELNVIKTGKPVSSETELIWEGKTRNVINKKFPLIDSEGKPYAVCILSLEITERVEAEEALRASKTQFQDIINNSLSHVLVKDLEGRYILVNPAFEKDNDISSQELMGKTVYDFFPKEKADEFWQQELNVLKTGTPVSSESSFVWRGKTRKFVDTKFPLFDSEGKPYAICIQGIEITERVEAEEALRESKTQFQDIVEYSQSRITVKDLEGRYILVNPAFEQDFNMSRQEMLGKTAHDFLPKEVADKFWLDELKVINTGIPQISESSMEWEGQTRIVTNTKFPLLDSEGKPYAICILGLDITERVEAEKKLQEYSENLEVLVEARTQELQDTRENLLRKENLALLGALAGSMSHDLRNPLAGISNAVYYLKTILTDTDEKVGDYLDIISNSVQRADEIIQKLRDLLSSNPVNKQKIKVSDLVSSALKISLIPENIKVNTKFPAKLPKVVVDSTQMQHVIDNLLSNAYQAMPNGGKINIGAQKKGNQVLISIQDDGSGISEEHKGKIFEPLFTTKETGMGLGLAVSKVIAEANGGNIYMESELGKGTTFTLSLPRESPAD